ncbi:MAG: N-6 DNA methylase [Candidatus Omnitrophica bacterium]|nr:N-6 DNA methylase [Candidatus Omnitrophota bacterium]
MKKKSVNGKELNFEVKLWQTADKLRNNMDAAEYKHIVLGLIFLKYISDAFSELYQKLSKTKGADPEDSDEYRAENIFYVPGKARWGYLQKNAKQPTIGKIIDDAMDKIEKDNTTLKGVLPKNYARPALDKQRLGQLIDLIGTIGLGDKENRSKDILGRVYEYFLGQFADAEGKRGGQFYTPRCIVKLLVEMLEPYKGRVFDPCCGSGGMFVQSEKFVQAHGGRIGDIAVYGQESNQTTWRLCKMNLAIRGIDANIAWNNEGSFLNNAHKDLKADFVIANPPFNDSDWHGEALRKDGRWKYGTPPTGNANFAWVQHFIYHLAPRGMAGFVLGNASLSSVTNGEDEIRKNIVEADLVDCIVSLPNKLFYNVQLPVTLWFVTRAKADESFHRNRRNESLFIDCENLGYLVDKQHRELKEEEIARIAATYHAWKSKDYKRLYKDVPGFCKSVTIQEIRNKEYFLVPKRYINSASGVFASDKFENIALCLRALNKDASELELKLEEGIKNLFSVDTNKNLEINESTISDYCSVEIGGDWGKESEFGDSVQVYCLRGVDLKKIKEIGFSDAPIRWIKKSSLEKRSLDENDILIGASGIGPIGRTLWMSNLISNSLKYSVTYSNFCKRLRCKTPEVAILIETFLEELYSKGALIQYKTGTSIPNLDVKGLLTHKIQMPAKDLANEMATALRTIIELRYCRAFEMANLKNLKDAVLNKVKELTKQK